MALKSKTKLKPWKYRLKAIKERIKKPKKIKIKIGKKKALA